MTDGDIVARIAVTLGETDEVPISQIRRIVELHGVVWTWEFVTKALEVEANGGMMLPGGSRRRTLGGVFFYLVKGALSEEERLAIFPPPRRKKPKPEPEARPEEPQQPRISQFWLDLAAGKPLSYRWYPRENAKP
jgi:hypothetical protein